MLRPVLPLFDYVINQDYIAEFLCVNTDKPELACNGKCYLMQKLNASNEEKRQNLPRIAMEEYPIGFVNFICIKIPRKISYTTISTIGYSNSYDFMYNATSFRPPNFNS